MSKIMQRKACATLASALTFVFMATNLTMPAYATETPPNQETPITTTSENTGNDETNESAPVVEEATEEKEPEAPTAESAPAPEGRIDSIYPIKGGIKIYGRATHIDSAIATDWDGGEHELTLKAPNAQGEVRFEGFVENAPQGEPFSFSIKVRGQGGEKELYNKRIKINGYFLEKAEDEQSATQPTGGTAFRRALNTKEVATEQQMENMEYKKRHSYNNQGLVYGTAKANKGWVGGYFDSRNIAGYCVGQVALRSPVNNEGNSNNVTWRKLKVLNSASNPWKVSGYCRDDGSHCFNRTDQSAQKFSELAQVVNVYGNDYSASTGTYIFHDFADAIGGGKWRSGMAIRNNYAKSVNSINDELSKIDAAYYSEGRDYRVGTTHSKVPGTASDYYVDFESWSYKAGTPGLRDFTATISTSGMTSASFIKDNSTSYKTSMSGSTKSINGLQDAGLKVSGIGASNNKGVIRVRVRVENPNSRGSFTVRFSSSAFPSNKVWTFLSDGKIYRDGYPNNFKEDNRYQDLVIPMHRDVSDSETVTFSGGNVTPPPPRPPVDPITPPPPPSGDLGLDVERYVCHKTDASACANFRSAYIPGSGWVKGTITVPEDANVRYADVYTKPLRKSAPSSYDIVALLDSTTSSAENHGHSGNTLRGAPHVFYTDRVAKVKNNNRTITTYSSALWGDKIEISNKVSVKITEAPKSAITVNRYVCNKGTSCGNLSASNLSNASSLGWAKSIEAEHGATLKYAYVINKSPSVSVEPTGLNAATTSSPVGHFSKADSSVSKGVVYYQTATMNKSFVDSSKYVTTTTKANASNAPSVQDSVKVKLKPDTPLGLSVFRYICNNGVSCSAFTDAQSASAKGWVKSKTVVDGTQVKYAYVTTATGTGAPKSFTVSHATTPNKNHLKVSATNTVNSGQIYYQTTYARLSDFSTNIDVQQTVQTQTSATVSANGQSRSGSDSVTLTITPKPKEATANIFLFACNNGTSCPAFDINSSGGKNARNGWSRIVTNVRNNTNVKYVYVPGYRNATEASVYRTSTNQSHIAYRTDPATTTGVPQYFTAKAVFGNTPFIDTVVGLSAKGGGVTRGAVDSVTLYQNSPEVSVNRLVCDKSKNSCPDLTQTSADAQNGWAKTVTASPGARLRYAWVATLSDGYMSSSMTAKTGVDNIANSHHIASSTVNNFGNWGRVSYEEVNARDTFSQGQEKSYVTSTTLTPGQKLPAPTGDRMWGLRNPDAGNGDAISGKLNKNQSPLTAGSTPTSSEHTWTINAAKDTTTVRIDSTNTATPKAISVKRYVCTNGTSCQTPTGNTDAPAKGWAKTHTVNDGAQVKYAYVIDGSANVGAMTAKTVSSPSGHLTNTKSATIGVHVETATASKSAIGGGSSVRTTTTVTPQDTNVRPASDYVTLTINEAPTLRVSRFVCNRGLECGNLPSDLAQASSAGWVKETTINYGEPVKYAYRVDGTGNVGNIKATTTLSPTHAIQDNSLSNNRTVQRGGTFYEMGTIDNITNKYATTVLSTTKVQATQGVQPAQDSVRVYIERPRFKIERFVCKRGATCTNGNDANWVNKTRLWHGETSARIKTVVTPLHNLYANATYKTGVHVLYDAGNDAQTFRRENGSTITPHVEGSGINKIYGVVLGTEGDSVWNSKTPRAFYEDVRTNFSENTWFEGLSKAEIKHPGSASTEASRIVTIDVSPAISVKLFVRKQGQGERDWVETITAQDGDKLEFKAEYFIPDLEKNATRSPRFKAELTTNYTEGFTSQIVEPQGFEAFSHSVGRTSGMYIHKFSGTYTVRYPQTATEGAGPDFINPVIFATTVEKAEGTDDVLIQRDTTVPARSLYNARVGICVPDVAAAACNTKPSIILSAWIDEVMKYAMGSNQYRSDTYAMYGSQVSIVNHVWSEEGQLKEPVAPNSSLSIKTVKTGGEYPELNVPINPSNMMLYPGRRGEIIRNAQKIYVIQGTETQTLTLAKNGNPSNVDVNLNSPAILRIKKPTIVLEGRVAGEGDWSSNVSAKQGQTVEWRWRLNEEIAGSQSTNVRVSVPGIPSCDATVPTLIGGTEVIHNCGTTPAADNQFVATAKSKVDQRVSWSREYTIQGRAQVSVPANVSESGQALCPVEYTTVITDSRSGEEVSRKVVPTVYKLNPSAPTCVEAAKQGSEYGTFSTTRYGRFTLTTTAVYDNPPVHRVAGVPSTAKWEEKYEIRREEALKNLSRENSVAYYRVACSPDWTVLDSNNPLADIVQKNGQPYQLTYTQNDCDNTPQALQCVVGNNDGFPEVRSESPADQPFGSTKWTNDVTLYRDGTPGGLAGIVPDLAVSPYWAGNGLDQPAVVRVSNNGLLKNKEGTPWNSNAEARADHSLSADSVVSETADKADFRLRRAGEPSWRNRITEFVHNNNKYWFYSWGDQPTSGEGAYEASSLWSSNSDETLTTQLRHIMIADVDLHTKSTVVTGIRSNGTLITAEREHRKQAQATCVSAPGMVNTVRAVTE